MVVSIGARLLSCNEFRPETAILPRRFRLVSYAGSSVVIKKSAAGVPNCTGYWNVLRCAQGDHPRAYGLLVTDY